MQPSEPLLTSRPFLRTVFKLTVCHLDLCNTMPWVTGESTRSTSTGFLVHVPGLDAALGQGARKRHADIFGICTAHGVVRPTSVRCSFPFSGRDVHAKVIATHHDCDLALLDLREFLDDLTPGSSGSYAGEITPLQSFLPKPDGQSLWDMYPVPPSGTASLVSGYPIGGNGQNLCKGIMGRVEVRTYVHSDLGLPMQQTDASFNSGVSGGPVVSHHPLDLSHRPTGCASTSYQLLGVAFQSNTEGSNINYVVPLAVVAHFIEQLRRALTTPHGPLGVGGPGGVTYTAVPKMEGFPALGVSTTEIKNTAIWQNILARCPELKAPQGVQVVSVQPMRPEGPPRIRATPERYGTLPSFHDHEDDFTLDRDRLDPDSLNPELSNVRTSRPMTGGGKLLVGDLILSVNGVPIAVDGTVEVPGVGSRVDWGVLYHLTMMDEKVDLVVLTPPTTVHSWLRPEPRVRKESLSCMSWHNMALLRQYLWDVWEMPWVVIGGLVFLPWSSTLIFCKGSKMRYSKPGLTHAVHTQNQEMLGECVVGCVAVINCLACEELGEKALNTPLLRVNGWRIRSMSDLRWALLQGQYDHQFGIKFTTTARSFFMSREAAMESKRRLVETHHIPDCGLYPTAPFLSGGVPELPSPVKPCTHWEVPARVATKERKKVKKEKSSSSSEPRQKKQKLL